jgi:zinc protease
MIKHLLLAGLCLCWVNTSYATNLQEATFANGAKLIVEEDHSAPVAMVQVWLKVGGRDEVPGKTGLAHVFEHMMFKGSKALPPGEYSKRISAMGGNDNAFTSHDFTAYFETVPAAQVDTVLKMEAERFANLALNADEFGREIKVIMEERRMRTDDDPNSHMFEELSAAALRLHPYRNPVIGWMQDLKKLTIEDVRAFYKKHYVARNATVVIVGDVDFNHVKKVVARNFGRMKNVAVPPRFNPTEPEPLGAKHINVHLPAKSPVIAITLPVPVWIPGKNDAEVAALAVATHILGAGRTAILQRQLVDKQRKAFAATAGYDPFGMGLDLWYAYGMLGSKQSPKDFETALWKILSTMASKPVTDKQLNSAKRNMIANQIFAQDSLYLRAKMIGRMETVGIGAKNKDAWLDAIRAVNAKDIQTIAHKYFQPKRATTGVLIPEAHS